MPETFWPTDLEALSTLAERVREVVVDHGARLVVEVWSKSDQGPVAWIEMYPGDSDPTIRFTHMREDDALGTPEVLEPDSVKALREQLAYAQKSVSEMQEAHTKITDRLEATVRTMHDHHGACICNTGPGTEGPDEYCPWHGRPWDDMLKRHERMVTEARATVGWVRTIRDRWATSENAHALWSEIDHALRRTITEDEPAEPAPVDPYRGLGYDGQTSPEPAPVEVVEEPEPGTRLISIKTGGKWHRSLGCERWHNDTLGGNCDAWDDLRKHHGPLTLVETGGQS